MSTMKIPRKQISISIVVDDAAYLEKWAGAELTTRAELVAKIVHRAVMARKTRLALVRPAVPTGTAKQHRPATLKNGRVGTVK